MLCALIISNMLKLMRIIHTGLADALQISPNCRQSGFSHSLGTIWRLFVCHFLLR